jgi:putative ABC transport system substrate-binding protein
MRRRQFIRGLGAAAAISSRGVHAQARQPIIGFLSVHSSTTVAPTVLPAFHRGLAEAGYIEGLNVSVEYLWADGSYERLPALVAELVRRRVDVIVAAGGIIAAQTAKAETTSIPIIALAGDDPVRLGLVSSINHPGGNVTGVAQLVGASERKRLEFTHELVPDANAIAYLTNPSRTNSGRQVAAMQTTATELGVTLALFEAVDDDDLPRAVAAARGAAGALIVAGDPYFFVRHEKIVALAERHALPAMYFFREFVAAGGLVSYGPNLADAYHQIGVYAGKVLKGGDPGNMPMVQQTDKLELVLNARTARTLGLTIPPTLLARAEEVIE